jgi:hypothetical protein
MEHFYKNIQGWFTYPQLAGHDYHQKEVRATVDNFFKDKPGNILEGEYCWKLVRSY